jgi:hypothetical protein
MILSLDGDVREYILGKVIKLTTQEQNVTQCQIDLLDL